MPYDRLADIVLLMHLGFVAFVSAGALLALRWPGVLWAHAPAAAWGAFVELTGRMCPLTPLENRLRAAAGHARYEGDFIERYLAPVVYPAGLTRDIQVTIGAALIVVNVVLYAIVWRRRGAGKPAR
jgi:hypothetical protein